MHFSLNALIQTVGYIGIFGIIFAESGLFFAFFLPGDSLLFSAGILAAAGSISLFGVMGVVIAGAVLGGIFGYYFGKKITATLFTRKDTFFFKKDHLERSHRFYEKHGTKTVVLGRFIPIVRTFVPILAGASLMHYTKFMIWNLIGGIIWALALPLLGYFLGSKIPNVDAYILPVILGIMAVSFVPLIYRYVKEKYAQ